MFENLPEEIIMTEDEKGQIYEYYYRKEINRLETINLQLSEELFLIKSLFEKLNIPYYYDYKAKKFLKKKNEAINNVK